MVVPLTPVIPNWLTNGCGVNGWTSVIYYTAAQNRLPAAACTTCTAASLSVNGVSGTDLVLLTPGAAAGARMWASGYFEDAENVNNDDNYITPTSPAYNRDRIYTVP